MSLRVVFMGTPDFAVPSLEALNARHAVVAVYTRAPAPAGRGMKPRPSPVQTCADRHAIAVETPGSLRGPDAQARLRDLRPDLAVVVAYGALLPQAVLDIPRLGCLNVHASLLPRWRGAAPIHRAVMAGDGETGLAIMRMEAGLDTGPVGLVERVPIGPDDTTGAVHDRLAALGGPLLLRALDALEAGRLAFAPQPDAGVTYARKIENADALIDWSRPAGAVHDHVRGLSPWPGAFFEADLGRGPERVKVLRAEPASGEGAPGTLLRPDPVVACGTGAVRLLAVQRAGRPPTDAAAFMRGVRIDPGSRLGSGSA